MDRTTSARRRKRRYVVLLAVVVALCAGWSAFWFFAAHQAETAIAGWRAREAKAGRVYTCGKQEVSGFPFRIEVDCTPATAQFDSGGKSYTAATDHVLVVGQIYTPGLLISEAKGPLTFGETGKPPTAIVNWKLAQSSVAGTPTNPQRVALVFDKPVVDAIGGGTEQTVLSAEHAEIHGRLVGGSISDKPVIEIALDVTKGMLPKLPSAAGKPIDTSIVARLDGLKDFTPKPWAARYREIQQAGGHIDIEKARITQGDSVAVGSGKLSLTPQGYLQGQTDGDGGRIGIVLEFDRRRHGGEEFAGDGQGRRLPRPAGAGPRQRGAQPGRPHHLRHQGDRGQCDAGRQIGGDVAAQFRQRRGVARSHPARSYPGLVLSF